MDNISFIDSEKYKKYLEEYDEYYKLKNKYENDINKKKEKIKTKANKENLPLSYIKKNIALLEFNCINCKKKGGTIFKETEDTLEAVCGNKTKQCNLNIKINKIKTENLEDKIISTNNEINNIKSKIIEFKTNFLFNFLEEDYLVEQFNILNTDLNEKMESFINMKQQYNNINTEIKNKDKLIEYKKELDILITEFKDIYKIYLNENDKKYLKQAFEFYLSKIKPLTDAIKNMSYKYNYLDKIENQSNNINYKLIQKKNIYNDYNILNI